MEMRHLCISWLVLTMMAGSTLSGNYSTSLTFLNSKLDSNNYNTQLRPLLDQNQVMNVSVLFELISIVEVDDVTQSFTCNGFLFFRWKDEILAWNNTNYDIEKIHPLPEKIWRPRVILINTLGDRDLFDDDKAPVFGSRDGRMVWVPGSLFPTACELEMTLYPFDVQTCKIFLVSMTFTTTELQFKVLKPEVQKTYFTTNGEWDVRSTEVVTSEIEAAGSNLSTITITFKMKRRPTFFLLNVLLPVVFLSFLNIFVFIIPAESGEKIGYGITVLLALSVYMSTVSNMLPSSSLTLPNVIIYLFLLLILSMVTVIGSIIIVLLHNMEEKEEVQQKARANFTAAFTKVNLLQRAVTSISKSNKTSDVNTIHPQQILPSEFSSEEDKKEVRKPKINKYKVIGRHINKICFIIFIIIYIGITLGFILSIALA